MNNKWKETVYDVVLGGWVTIPNYLAHNFKALGLNAEMTMFIIDILTNSEDFYLHDEYMSIHGESRTLRRFRAELKKLGYMEWTSYSRKSSNGTYKHTGFRYNLDGLLNKIKEKVALAKNGQPSAQNGQPNAVKCIATKESISKESISKESFNNIHSGVSAQSASHTECESIEEDRTTDKASSRFELEELNIDNIDAYMQDCLAEEKEYFDALEAEDDEDSADFSLSDIEGHVNDKVADKFIKLYIKARKEFGLPPLDNIDAHKKNIQAAPAHIVQEYINYPYLFGWFFRYCIDKYNMSIRHFECNSKREPSVIVNESVDLRFSDWFNNRRANVEQTLVGEK